MSLRPGREAPAGRCAERGRDPRLRAPPTGPGTRRLRTEEVHLGAVGAARPRGRSCRPRPEPLTAHGPAFLPAEHCVARGSCARWPRRSAGTPATARAWPEQGPGQSSRSEAGQHDPDRLLIRRPVPAGDRVPRSAHAGQVFLASPPDPLANRGEPVVPRGGERADRDRDQAGQRVIRPCGERGSGSASSRCQVPAARSSPPGPDSTTRAHARQCHCGHATPRSCRPQRPT